MTLAKRVRDFRYAKGWGPDELASRAEISRTALYQIESGKTELPRAGTLRRIAKALDVSIDMLLGNEVGSFQLSSFAHGAPEPPAAMRSPQSAEGMVAQEASFARAPAETYSAPEGAAAMLTGRSMGYSQAPLPARERELAVKLHELLASPLGEGVARIVEESYRLLPVRSAR
ncbi:MAG TPA: helix-turn-helix transcriptional regulator [Isosphaeraceae bacterium]|nr:helix-turn-helix transcriptional regulator [Isosphaeraceae bacterium]